jgi:hypothetical protein
MRRRRTALTDEAIARLPVRDKRYSEPDRGCTGLWIRVQPTTGTKTFIVVARNPEGKQIWATGELCNRQSIDEARVWARAVIKRIRNGEGAFEPIVAGQYSFRRVAEDWIELYAKAKGVISVRKITSCLETYVYPVWGTRWINSIKKSDITALLDKVQKKSALFAQIRS